MSFNILLKKKVAIILFLFLYHTAYCEHDKQFVKGVVLDQQSESPIFGAVVMLLDSTNKIVTTTDLDGNFTLSKIPIGRQSFEVTYFGYHTTTVRNIEVTNGKEVFLKITIEERVHELKEIVIFGKKKGELNNKLSNVSARSFRVEETRRYSGGRSDVARIASNFAGVVTANDSRNDIVVRGNSPTGVLWKLEGIPIPNPNHFSTLGTTGGIINALNINTLSNSDFLTSAFPSEYGEALAGVFDIQMRSGNKDKTEFTLQSGSFNGIETMLEGPLVKKANGSYLISGRYSFVELAHKANINIKTNATPDYRDISLKLNFGKTKLGKLTVFGIGGVSDVQLEHEDVGEDDLFVNTDEDSYANSNFGVIGIKNKYYFNSKTYLKSIFSVSTSGNDFNQYRILNINTDSASRTKFFETTNKERRTSFSSYINKKINAKWSLRLGTILEHYRYGIFSKDRLSGLDTSNNLVNDWITIYDFDEGITLTQAFSHIRFKPNEKWVLNMGLHSQTLLLNLKTSLEPRLSASYSYGKHRSYFGYGYHSKLAPIPIFLLEQKTNGTSNRTNTSLDFTKSHHFVLGHEWKFNIDWNLKIESYLQLTNNAPIEPHSSSFSVLNSGNDFTFPTGVHNLENKGFGLNKGIELTLEKYFSKNYYLLLTSTVYDSKYKGSDGILRNSAFNNRYIYNILLGKESILDKSKRIRLTTDVKFTWAGGRYYTPINLSASRIANTEIKDDENAFSKRHTPYLRWDFKIGIKVNSKKHNFYHHFFIDLQNVTNKENIFTTKYNRVKENIVNVYQLGFIPEIMYKIQF